MIFAYVVIFLETRKNPKFEGLKINNGQDNGYFKIFRKFTDLGTLTAFFPWCH